MEQQADHGQPTETEQQEPTPQVIVSLDVFQSIRQAQAQHGLRHSDFKRYRQYCTRKLQRTRKALKLTHGRGKFQARIIEADMVTDSKHLSLPLISAERAWSLAKELETQNQEGISSHKRQHQVRRFSKAAQWASELARLAGATADNRTHLEAEAYAASLGGLALQYKGKDMATAVAKFSRAEAILQHLCEVGTYEQQSACRQQLEDVQGSLRFVKYELGRKGGHEPKLPASHLDDIQAKLDSVAAEQPAPDNASNMTSLTWRGISYHVRNMRIRANLQQVAELSQQHQDGMQIDQAAHEAGQHDALIGALNETKASLGTVLKTAPGGADMAGADRDDLEQLERAVRGRLLEVQILKLYVQCRASESQFDAYLDVANTAARPKEQSSKAESLVRLYDSIASAAEALGKLAGEELRGAQAELLEEEAAAKVIECKARRCFYVAHAYLASGKQLEAHALFGRAAQHAKLAAKHHQDCTHVDEQAVQHMELLGQQAAAWQCVAHAESAAAEQESHESVTQATSSLSLQQKATEQHRQQQQYMLDNLDKWGSFVGVSGKDAHLTPVPPALQQIAIRPFMLDNALSYLAAPSIDHRVAKQEQPKSAFAKLFTWNKK
ncbi:hypothetical protein ABBQ38_006152 [Trebouxia sp. C0009 RCD-2024]